MTGQRVRLVITQNGDQHIASLILAADEVPDHLELEARMHELAGWQVDRIYFYGMLASVYCEMGDIAREIKARLFDPMEDTTT